MCKSTMDKFPTSSLQRDSLTSVSPDITLTVSPEPTLEPIFTRYLYIKPDVYVSLYTAIVVDKKRDEALFWAYELYYSGWGYELMGFLAWVAAKHIQRRKVRGFVDNTINAWRVHKKDAMVATVVLNMMMPDTGIIMYVHYSEKDIAEFQTVKVSDPKVRHWKVLQSVCIYATKKNIEIGDGSFSAFFRHHHTRDRYTQFFRGDWEYYAYFTPVWKQRFETYGGQPCHESQKMGWTKKDEITEMFYEKFGYEPDEQPLEILHRLIGR